ncbi:MAG: lipoprotein bor [Alcaligenaceae bacterium]|nr:lipoprotein bor [Alcaligenaceae bacterium]
MKKLMVSALALCSLLLTGCMTTGFTLKNQPVNTPTYDQSVPYFVSGLGQKQEVDAAKICGGSRNIVKVETLRTPLNIVIGIATAGIYTPEQVRVYCK